MEIENKIKELENTYSNLGNKYKPELEMIQIIKYLYKENKYLKSLVSSLLEED